MFVFLELEAQGTRVSETKEFRQTYVRFAPNKAMFATLEEDIQCYRGDKALAPDWIDIEPSRPIYL